MSGNNKSSASKGRRSGRHRRDDSDGFDSRNHYAPFWGPQQQTWVPQYGQPSGSQVAAPPSAYGTQMAPVYAQQNVGYPSVPGMSPNPGYPVYQSPQVCNGQSCLLIRIDFNADLSSILSKHLSQGIRQAAARWCPMVPLSPQLPSISKTGSQGSAARLCTKGEVPRRRTTLCNQAFPTRSASCLPMQTRMIRRPSTLSQGATTGTTTSIPRRSLLCQAVMRCYRHPSRKDPSPLPPLTIAALRLVQLTQSTQASSKVSRSRMVATVWPGRLLTTRFLDTILRSICQLTATTLLRLRRRTLTRHHL